MPPRSVFRWKTLWLGLLVLGFLGWAWGYSMGKEEYLSYASSSRPRSGIALAYVEGDCSILYYRGGGVPFAPGFHITREAPGERLVPTSPFDLQSNGERGWFLRLAHWFLMLLVAVPWIAFLLWRFRRQKRLAGQGWQQDPAAALGP